MIRATLAGPLAVPVVPPTSTGLTWLWPTPPGVAPPGATVTALRSSTGTSSSLTPLEQAASKTARVAARNTFFFIGGSLLDVDSGWMVAASAPERAPVGLANVAAAPGQPGLDLAVEGGGHQRFGAVLARGVNDQTAVGCKARAFVGRGVGDRLHVAAGEFHHLQLERAADAGNIGQRASVGAQRRGDVVTPRKGDALRLPATGRHAV